MNPTTVETDRQLPPCDECDKGFPTVSTDPMDHSDAGHCAYWCGLMACPNEEECPYLA